MARRSPFISSDHAPETGRISFPFPPLSFRCSPCYTDDSTRQREQFSRQRGLAIGLRYFSCILQPMHRSFSRCRSRYFFFSSFL